MEYNLFHFHDFDTFSLLCVCLNQGIKISLSTEYKSQTKLQLSLQCWVKCKQQECYWYLLIKCINQRNVLNVYSNCTKKREWGRNVLCQLMAVSAAFPYSLILSQPLVQVAKLLSSWFTGCLFLLRMIRDGNSFFSGQSGVFSCLSSSLLRTLVLGFGEQLV